MKNIIIMSDGKCGKPFDMPEVCGLRNHHNDPCTCTTQAAQPTPAAHTPLPFFVRKPLDDSKFIEIVTANENGIDYFVCRTWGEKEEDKANAAFIVRAVNSHEALLEAVKEAKQDAERQLYLTRMSEEKDRLSGLIGSYTQAIAQAEGK